VGFIEALLREIERNHPQLDTRQVYVTGMSNGAMMAYRLACEMPNRIRAIAPVAAAFVYDGPCAAQGVSLLHIHSKLDGHVPFIGGEGVGGNSFPPVLNGIKQWQELNACFGEEKNRLNPQLTLIQYNHCRSRAGVKLYITHDGGHSWPGAEESRLRGDPVSDALIATDVIWDFFNQCDRHR
jgi:polyhydroxybutyrate depolymerase